jgi:mRNA interferase MazF
LVRFPFSDLSNSKLRPAVVLADAGRGDWILCQITSKAYADTQAIELTTSDFSSGSLIAVSYARPGKLFTASTGIMTRIVGQLTQSKVSEVLKRAAALFDVAD